MFNYLKFLVLRYGDISVKFRWATKKADFNEEIGLSILWFPELDGSGTGRNG
jgi:glutathione peroxidase-family protein